MAVSKPFLTAQWLNLIMLSYRLDPAMLEPFLPPGCSLDLLDGSAFASLVAFDFADTRVMGIRWPGFVRFPEINLRFYVRCNEGAGDQRGVCFIREYVRQRTVATMARWIYNEPYRVAPLQSSVESTGSKIHVRHTLKSKSKTCSVQVTGSSDPFCPAPDSTECFFREQQWGFGTSRSRKLIRYQVLHPVWNVYPVESYQLDWDWRAVYGPHWSPLQNMEPMHVMLAAGSRGCPGIGERMMPEMNPPETEAKVAEPLIVLYDGDCGPCDHLVRFILDHDKQKKFRFAPQQSQAAQELLKTHDIDPAKLDSVVLIDGPRAYIKSSATLRIAEELPDPWPLAGLAVFVPRFIRDSVYDYIARHRKQWFKKPEQCRTPSAEEREQFLG